MTYAPVCLVSLPLTGRLWQTLEAIGPGPPVINRRPLGRASLRPPDSQVRVVSDDPGLLRLFSLAGGGMVAAVDATTFGVGAVMTG